MHALRLARTPPPAELAPCVLACADVPRLASESGFAEAARRGPVLLDGTAFWTDWSTDAAALLERHHGGTRIADLRTFYGGPVNARPADRALADEVRTRWTLGAYLEAARAGTVPVYVSNLALPDLPALAVRYRSPKLAGPNLFAVRTAARAPELFVGPSNTQFGGLHADGCAASVWSLGLAGTKEWIVFPPSDGHALYAHYRGDDPQLRHSLLDPWDAALCARFPTERLRPHRILQRPGDALFLPPNWWHVTRNVGFTMTINERTLRLRDGLGALRHTAHFLLSDLVPGTRPFALY